jgi:hypothetical protein
LNYEFAFEIAPKRHRTTTSAVWFPPRAKCPPAPSASRGSPRRWRATSASGWDSRRCASTGLLVCCSRSAGAPSVVSFTLDRGRITEIDIVRNPEKLGTLERLDRSARAGSDSTGEPRRPDLPEHPGLPQRALASHVPVVERTDPLGDDPIETADTFGRLVGHYLTLVR